MREVNSIPDMNDDEIQTDESSIILLPPEILQVIVSYLPYQEMSNLMLVSTLWKEITEDPLVWKQFQLSVNEDKMHHLNGILDIKRLTSLRKVKTAGRPFSACYLTLLFNLIQKKTSITNLDLTNTDVCNVDPDLLSETINSMDKVNLDMNLFTFSQADSVFAKMREKTQLRSLSVKYNTLSMVDPHVLADCLSRLEELDLTNAYVTDMQVQALFTAMARHTNLAKLTLVEIIIADVEADLFALCAHKVKYLKLTNQNTYCLTQQQMTALCSKTHQQSQLKKIDLQFLDLSLIDPECFACFINSLDIVSISNATITDEQVKLLFEHMKKDTNLKELSIDIINPGETKGEELKMITEAMSNKRPWIKINYTLNTKTLFYNHCHS